MVLEVYRVESRPRLDGGQPRRLSAVRLRRHAQGVPNPLITPHARYLALRPERASRSRAYRSRFDPVMSEATVAGIRRTLQQHLALGTDRFREWVEARTGRFAGLRTPGRPASPPVHGSTTDQDRVIHVRIAPGTHIS